MRKGGKRSVSDGSGRSAPRLSYDEGVYFFVFSTRVVLQTLNPRAPPPREGVGYVRPRDRSGRVVVGGALVRTHSRSDQPSPPVSLERTYHSRDALKSRTNALESMDAPPSSPNTPARPAPRAPLPALPSLIGPPSTSPALRPPPPVAPPRPRSNAPRPGPPRDDPLCLRASYASPRYPIPPPPRWSRRSKSRGPPAGPDASPPPRRAPRVREPVPDGDRSRTRARSPPRWRVGFRTPRRRLRRFSSAPPPGVRAAATRPALGRALGGRPFGRRTRRRIRGAGR